MEELEKMSVVELRKYGKQLGINYVTKYKKKELVEEIQRILEQNGEQKKQTRQRNTKKTGKKTEQAASEEQSSLVEKPVQKQLRTRRTSKRTEEKRDDIEVLEEKRYPKADDFHRSTPAREDESRSIQVREDQRRNMPVREDQRRNVPVREDQRRNVPVRDDQRRNMAAREDQRRSLPTRDDQRRGVPVRDDQRRSVPVREDRRTAGPVREEQKYIAAPYEDQKTGSRDEHNFHTNLRGDAATMPFSELAQLDSGEKKQGILEVMPEGYGFVRCDNYLPGAADVYVSPAMIRKFGLRTGDILVGNTRIKNQNEKFSALLYVDTVNGYTLEQAMKRSKFENLTPIFPNEKIHLEIVGAKNNISMRMMDLISPIGKGQRGMIVSQPKTGKTTLLKQVARSVTHNHPSMHLIVLLIDERPEEVTDIKESIEGENVEVIYSTFDELPENHKRVSEMVIGRAKRLVEHGEDVIILLDSITRLARAYNLTVQPSGRTLSGGLDPAALYMPKRFFGAARNMREGGSLTILATALVDTGSKMDDVVFEEFKGTGNMEMVLDRRLSEKRLFPAIDLPRSSTRRDDLLLNQEEIEANFLIRKAFNGAKSEEAVENIISMFRKTKSNAELVQLIKKVKIV